MNKIELQITTDSGLKQIGIFDNVDQVRKWVEEFYQISYNQMKSDYEKDRDELSAYKKYPELFKEYTLDVWFEKNGVKLIYKDSFSFSKRYDNGEIVTKPRMEDEEWYYSLYQPFLEFSICYVECLPDVDKTYENALISFKNLFNKELSIQDKERILRWSVLHCERQSE